MVNISHKIIADIIKNCKSNNEHHIFNKVIIPCVLVHELSKQFQKEVITHREKMHLINGVRGCPSSCWCWEFHTETFRKECGE